MVAFSRVKLRGFFLLLPLQRGEFGVLWYFSRLQGVGGWSFVLGFCGGGGLVGVLLRVEITVKSVKLFTIF